MKILKPILQVFQILFFILEVTVVRHPKAAATLVFLIVISLFFWGGE